MKPVFQYSNFVRHSEIKISLLLVALLVCFAPVMAQVQDILESDGVRYHILDGDSTLCLVGCSDRPSLVVPARVSHEGESYSVVSIGSGALSHKATLASITLPVTLREIGDEAFAGCDALSGAVVIPEGVERLGVNAFSGCVAIKSLSLPSTLQNLGSGVFARCDGIDTVFSHVAASSLVLSQLPHDHAVLCVDAPLVEGYSGYQGPLRLLVDVDGEPGSGSLCDVTHDGVVNAADLTMVYNSLLLSYDAHADANGDNLVTSADVTAIYDALLDGNTSGVGDKGYCFAVCDKSSGNLMWRVAKDLSLLVNGELCVAGHDNEQGCLTQNLMVLKGGAPNGEILDMPGGARALSVSNKSYNTGTTTQMVLCMPTPGDTIYYKDVNVYVQRHVITDTLRVLSIGNSFSLDALSYLPFVMKAVAPQVYLKLDIMYIGGGTLSAFYNALDSTTHAPMSDGMATSFIHYWSHGAKPWDARREVPMTSIIEAQPWDVIVLQQQSNASRDYSTYQPYLNQIIQWIDSKASYPHQYAWLITPSYPDNLPRLAPDTTSTQMFERILDCVGNVMSDTGIELLLPCGTAIQNARTTPLDSLGDQGHLFDYLHLQEGIPCLIETYAVCAALLARYGLSDMVWADSTWISQQWLHYNNIQELNGDPVGMSEENRAIAKQCAIKALESPLSITVIE